MGWYRRLEGEKNTKRDKVRRKNKGRDMSEAPKKEYVQQTMKESETKEMRKLRSMYGRKGRLHDEQSDRRDA